MKITIKNFLFSISIIFTVTTVSLTILYFIMPMYYEYTKLNKTSQEFNKIADDMEGKNLEEIKKIIDQRLFDGQEAITFILLDQNGRYIYPDVEYGKEGMTIGLGEVKETETTDSSDLTNVLLSPNEGKKLNQLVKDNLGNQYKLVGFFSLQPISDASEVLLQIYPFLLLIDFLIGGIAAYFYSKFSTKRIKQISLSTNQMLSLDNTIKCEIKGKDELALLAQDINQLNQSLLMTIDALKSEITKVEGIERSKAEFMRVTSHELKTPLASLMGIVDGMIYNVGKFKDRDQYLMVCKEILHQQADMIQNVLTVSKLDMFSLDETNNEIFSFKDLVKSKLKAYELLAEVNNIKLAVNLKECLIEGNVDEMSKVIDNILNNAVRYTKVNGLVNLYLDQSVFLIENQVIKRLSEDELSQLFEPFYRPDFSRNRETGGSGLGLYIVKQILDKQGLNFSFRELESERMCFSIYFNEMQQG